MNPKKKIYLFDEALWDALRDIVVAGGSHFGEVEFQWASTIRPRGLRSG